MKIWLILIPVAAFYVSYTVKYSILFRDNRLFSPGVKRLHYVLFWMIPFVWIMLVKAMSADTEGTAYYYRHREWMEDETKPEPGSGE